MNNKFISTQSNKILNYFNQMNMDCFIFLKADWQAK
jgi:hypothetical protein